MPPKPKRLPPPTLHHLKHSRQLLEDFMYQYLPQLSSLGAISRINVFCWFSGKWGLTPDAKGGLPFMVLEALRQQRQHLLSNKSTIKPLGLSLFGSADDSLLPKALPLLQELNNQSHTARISHQLAGWKEILKELQLQLQRQPATERNLLLLDPLDLPISSLRELLQLLPKRLDVLLLMPAPAVALSGGYVPKKEPAEAMAALSATLSPLLTAPAEEQTEEKTLPLLFQELKQGLAGSTGRFVMHYSAAAPEHTVCLYGLSHDALMMEKMLQARQKLKKISEKNVQPGNQLGLFGGGSTADAETDPAAAEINICVERILSAEEELDNQALYTLLLQHELLPQEGIQGLQYLIEAGKLDVLNEKKKKQKSAGTLPISHTAYKLPAPSCYFRLKANS
ncbi:hypothetical protein [Cesiribacter sp. SM1]|uniref:hypothetical protein n=1 Tax=Cesiribacter sp. SM1 TaxID=2861196 RepID=UPI001CD4C5DC|nr:hypothetical protein [Cesiribacter sp. SM1]